MKRRLSWFLALSVFLLSGCINSYPAPAPRSLYNIFSSATDDSQLAIAVDSSGTKYIVRADCPTNEGDHPSCKITYESTRLGEVGVLWYFTPDSGYTFRNPDIAVTNSNVAYMVWQNCPANDPSGRACSTLYTTSDDMTPHILDAATNSLSAPILAGRGDAVYAVHEVTNGYAAGSVLRFCPISNPNFVCHFVSDHPATDDGVRRTSAAAAVTSTSALHVAWLAASGSGVTAYINDNEGALDSPMIHQSNLGTASYFPPSIAIETDDGYVYTILAVNEPSTSDWMMVHSCAPATCHAGGDAVLVNLPADKDWIIFDTPSIATNDSGVLFGFAAVNNDHPKQSEIYLASYQAGSTAPKPWVPYATDLGDYNHDCDPKVGIVEGWPVHAWHVCGMDTVRGDVYFFDMLNDGRIIHESDSNGRGGLDMAVNGEYVAGIWNEKRADGRIETWLAFNANMNYIPVVQR